MKKIVIGGFIMLAGLLITLTIILSAAIFAAELTSWSGKSKLWFSIFGARQYGNEVVDSLFLGFPFVIGVLLAILGLVILAMEYYRISKDRE